MPKFAQRRLYIPVLLWLRLVWSLRRRGEGRRESGAFLLGSRGDEDDRVRFFVCYDDLDPHALDTGIITFAPSGFSALWSRCRDLRCDVLADVHTHPDPTPQQSETDRLNPMIAEAGHMAIILPEFAQRWGWRFRNVALYEYSGNYTWRPWMGTRRSDRVQFQMW